MGSEAPANSGDTISEEDFSYLDKREHSPVNLRFKFNDKRQPENVFEDSNNKVENITN